MRNAGECPRYVFLRPLIPAKGPYYAGFQSSSKALICGGASRCEAMESVLLRGNVGLLFLLEVSLVLTPLPPRQSLGTMLIHGFMIPQTGGVFSGSSRVCDHLLRSQAT